ncbi:hypothetical protein BDR05DRAFT_953633, partial [Suillus weaverae]
MTWTQDEKGTGFMFSRCLIVSCYGWHLGRQAQMLVVLYMAQAQTLGSTFLSVVNARKRMLMQFELIPFGDKRKRSSPISPHGPSANARATIPLIFTTLGTPEVYQQSQWMQSLGFIPACIYIHDTLDTAASLPTIQSICSVAEYDNHISPNGDGYMHRTYHELASYISPTRARGSRLIALKAIAHTCQYQIGVLFESLTMLNANTRRVTLRLGISFVPHSNRLQSGTTSIIPHRLHEKLFSRFGREIALIREHQLYLAPSTFLIPEPPLENKPSTAHKSIAGNWSCIASVALALLKNTSSRVCAFATRVTHADGQTLFGCNYVYVRSVTWRRCGMPTLRIVTRIPWVMPRCRRVMPGSLELTFRVNLAEKATSLAVIVLFSPAMPRCKTPSCDYNARKKSLLEKHMRETHVLSITLVDGSDLARASDLSFHCPLCNHTVLDAFAMRTHHKRHFEGGPSPSVQVNPTSPDLTRKKKKRSRQQASDASERSDASANAGRETHGPVVDRPASPQQKRKKKKKKTSTSVNPEPLPNVTQDHHALNSELTPSPEDLAVLHGISIIVDAT